jgi:Na+-transporting methylmalonyl-CoA/oxaloacetate decarboxylase gamma subunit
MIGSDIDMIPANGTGQIAVKLVGDLQGKPIVNKEVTITVTAGSVDESTIVTDENGTVVFTYHAPDNMLPSHYVFQVTSWDGAVYYFGVEVGGNYANTSAISNEINELNQNLADTTNQLNHLQDQYSALQNNYTKLQDDYNTLQGQKHTATMLEYTFLGLFILMLIVAIALYYMGKKSGAKGGEVPEEESSEETEEEEELGEEETEEEETSEETEETSEGEPTEETSEEENAEE